MGAFAGNEDELLPRENSTGDELWVRRDVREINSAASASLEYSWINPLGADYNRLSPKALENFLADAEKVVEQMNRHPLWFIKESRMGMLYRFWQPLLGDDTIAVVCWRNPLDVAMELRDNNDLPLVYGLALWEWQTVRALQVVENVPYSVVSYDAILRNPVEGAKALYRACHKLGAKRLHKLSKERVDELVPSSAENQPPEITESSVLTEPQLHLLRWLRSSLEKFDGDVSEGATAVLKEIGSLLRKCGNALEQAAAADKERQSWEIRARHAEKAVDDLSDASLKLLDSYSWKAGRIIGAAARALTRSEQSAPEDFIRMTIRRYRDEQSGSA
jgi:hypothetical protein